MPTTNKGNVGKRRPATNKSAARKAASKAPAKTASKPPKAAKSRAEKKPRRRTTPETVEIPPDWLIARDLLDLAERAKNRNQTALAKSLAALAVEISIGDPPKTIVVPLALLDAEMLDHLAWLADEEGKPTLAKIFADLRVKHDEADDAPPVEKPLEMVEINLRDIGPMGVLRLFLHAIHAESYANRRAVPDGERSAYGIWYAHTEAIRTIRDARGQLRGILRGFLARPTCGLDHRKIRVPADWREEIELSGCQVFSIPSAMLTQTERVKIGERMDAAGLKLEGWRLKDFRLCPESYPSGGDRAGNESER